MSFERSKVNFQNSPRINSIPIQHQYINTEYHQPSNIGQNNLNYNQQLNQQNQQFNIENQNNISRKSKPNPFTFSYKNQQEGINNPNFYNAQQVHTPQNYPQGKQLHSSTQSVKIDLYPALTQYPQRNDFQPINPNATNNDYKEPRNLPQNQMTNPIPTLESKQSTGFGWGESNSQAVEQGDTTFTEQIGFHGNSKQNYGYQKKGYDVDNRGQGSVTVHKQQTGHHAQNYCIYNELNYEKGENMIAKKKYEANPIFTQILKTLTFPNPSVKYKIIPYLDQKRALDVTSVNDSKRKLKKNNLIIWSYHGGPNQIYYIKRQQNGNCIIVNTAKGFVVKVPEIVMNNQTQMEVGPMLGGPNQRWDLKPFADGFYHLVSEATGKTLDLFHQQYSDGTPVIQWDITGRKNQLWRIAPA